jgi:hypothetical protein
MFWAKKKQTELQFGGTSIWNIFEKNGIYLAEWVAKRRME